MKLLAIVLLALLLQTAAAQSKLGVVTLFKNNREGSRKALVIANQHYQHQKPLDNTLRDADSMTVALRYLGFVVTPVKDKILAQTQDAIDRFVASLQPGDVAFVYYSGHGMGYLLDNYLLPIEFAIETLEEIKNRAISTTDLRKRIMDRSVRNLFLVVDACRNEVDAKGNDPFQLVAPKNNPPGTLTAFATDYGLTASYQSRTNKNSLYTESLLLYLRQPLEVQEIFRLANNRTYSQSIRLKLPTQYPHYIPMIYDDYYFLKRVSPIAPTPPAKPATTKYLDLPFADLVYVPGGTFQMGDTRNEGQSDENPVHSVTVSSFLIGKYEVTQRQWENVMGSNPSHFNDCPDCPVESVSWEDVQEFLKKLNTRTVGNYRLPTEAEWEYAAGGGSGTRTRFGNGRDVLEPSEANFDSSESYKKTYSVSGESRSKTVPVGSFRANALGLYDMTGNVSEWCVDWYGPDYYASSTSSNPTGPPIGPFRVLRGGSWNYNSQFCRVANRINYSPSFRFNSGVGFRVVSPLQ